MNKKPTLQQCAQLANKPVVITDETGERMRMYIGKGGEAFAYNLTLQGRTYRVETDGSIQGDESGEISRLLSIVSEDGYSEADALEIVDSLFRPMSRTRSAVRRTYATPEQTKSNLLPEGFPRYKGEIGQQLNVILQQHPDVQLFRKHELEHGFKFDSLLRDHRILALHDILIRVLPQAVDDREVLQQAFNLYASGNSMSVYFLAVPKGKEGLFEELFGVALGQ